MTEREWREKWAEYFDARAAKSEANGRKYPQHADTWKNKAMGERECAMMLRDPASLDELYYALSV